LFAVELVAITLCLDNDGLSGYGGVLVFCHDWGPLILRGVVVFATLFLTFAFLKFSSRLQVISGQMDYAPIQRGLLVAHFISLTLFAACSTVLYGHLFRNVSSDLPALVWLSSGLAAIAFGAAAFVRPVFWAAIGRSTGYLWVLALAAALAAGFGGNAMRVLWPWATGLTLSIVEVLLKPFGAFTANAAAMTIGNGHFSEEIAPTCSGLEGVGLILSFTSAWLFLFRRECRFPQALILLPLGTVLLFLLNSVRIAVLMLIGSAGFVSIAEGGFHSQAGWIAFNFVALGTSVAAREVGWISKRQGAAVVRVSNPTAAWVMPFVVILAAGMVSRALTGGFEWLYPLRFFAAAAALWVYRPAYVSLDWHVDWTAPVLGLAVFAFWIALDRSGPVAIPGELAGASLALRSGWIILRILAAVVTVPIAEELAFRGFLLRRLISPDFEAVPFRAFSWLALLASSVIFGLLHGQRRVAGSLAGICFALAMQRRGRFGNAVIAHATANALLAVDVLVFHWWDLW
jgi:exosortase E/protease (VPEID-CTERM system)